MNIVDRRHPRRGRRREHPVRPAGQGARRVAALPAGRRAGGAAAGSGCVTICGPLWTPRRPYTGRRTRTACGSWPRSTPSWPRRRAGGGPKYVERHRGRGKLLARERIELLLDRDSAFLELSPLAAWGSDYAVGASLVTGIGVVSGVECVVIANDPTVRGGASNPWTVRKAFRRPRHRPGEPAAAGQPRRVRRRRPAQPGRDLRPRRAAVPRPDPAVRGRDPDGGAGLRQLDRGRRVRARDERPRRDDHGSGRRCSWAARRW